MQADKIKGELIGITASDDNESPDFDEVPIWVDPESDPALDSFVIIERTPKILQYGRLSSGYEHSDRADPQRQQRDTSFNFNTRQIRESNIAPDIVRVMRIDLLGEVEFHNDGTFSVRRPTKLPRVGKEVYELGASELPTLLDIPGELDEGLEIGTFESGGETIPLKLDSQFVSRHVAILGRTGVGKTHTGHVMIEELINYDQIVEQKDSKESDTEKENNYDGNDRGVPVITFDIENDIGPMAEDVGGTTLDPAGDSMFIPFQLIGWNEFDRFLGDMPTNKQKEVIASGYSQIRQTALNSLEQNGNLGVGQSEFIESVKSAAERRDYNYGETATGRALSVINQSSVLDDKMNDWSTLMADNPINNIDVSGLGDSERGAVISATARMLQVLREREEVPPFVLAIDEAHEFVSSGRSGKSTEVVRDLVKTARHIGVGVILMTQSPSELDSRTLRTCNTYVTLALAQPEVSEIEGLLSDLSSRSLEQIPNMEQGRAFVGTARDIMTHTVPVQIRDRKTAEGAPTPNLVEDSEKWFTKNDPYKTFNPESDDNTSNAGLNDFGE